MMSTQEMCRVVAVEVESLHLELARKWGFPTGLLAGATFGLAVAMMRACGCSEEQIVEVVRRVVEELSASPGARGVS